MKHQKQLNFRQSFNAVSTFLRRLIGFSLHDLITKKCSIQDEYEVDLSANKRAARKARETLMTCVS